MANYVKENQRIKYSERVDPETGELITEVEEQELTIQRFYKSTDEFIQVYLEDMTGLLKITSKGELRVLCFLWKWSSYQASELGNCVSVCPKLIADLIKETGMNDKTIRNIISKLSKQEILIKDKKIRATYYLNPIYFFKGPIKDRPRKIKTVIEYNNMEEDQETNFNESK